MLRVPKIILEINILVTEENEELRIKNLGMLRIQAPGIDRGKIIFPHSQAP